MNRRKKRFQNKLLRFVLVVFGVLLALMLGRVVQNQVSTTGGLPRITLLKKEDFVFPDSGNLRHFYEFAPNTIVDDRPSWLDKTPIIIINDDGINAQRSFAEAKPPHTFRIMTIGDSITFGQYVDTQNNFSEVMERMLNAGTCRSGTYEVMNLGVPGYDLAYTVEHFVRKGVKYHPDLVIWLITSHNMLQIQDLLQDREASIEATLTDREKDDAQKQGVYYLAMTQAQQELVTKFGEQNILAWQLQHLQRLSQVYSGPLLIVNFVSNDTPEFMALIDQFVSKRPQTWWYRQIPDLGPEGMRYPDRHPNAEGHKTIATYITRFAQAKGLIACPQ